MKINKIFLASLLLLLIMTLGAVSAENSTAQDGDTLSLDENTDIKISAENISDNNEKQDYDITLDEIPSEIVKGDYSYQTQITFTGPDNEKPNPISIYVDGKLLKTDTIDWTWQRESPPNIPTSDLSVGNHVLTINLPGNDYYNSKNITQNFKIVNSKISIPEYCDPTHEASVVLRTTADATGSLIVKINGTKFKEVALKLNSEENVKYAKIPIIGIKPGTYEIEATYTGDKKFKKQTLKKTVTVTYSIEAYSYIYSYGDSHNYIDIYLPENVKKIPIVSVNGETFEVKKKYSDTFTADMTYFPIGNHTVYITYPGDDIYPEKTVNLTVENRAKIQLHTSEGWKENAILLHLPKDAEGNLTVNVDGNLYQSQELVDGFAKINLDLPLQRYHFHATYTGNDYTVNDLNRDVTIEPLFNYTWRVTYGTQLNMKIYLNPDSKGNISYIPPYSSQYVPLEVINGSANLTINTKEIEFLEVGGVFFTVYFKYESENYTDTFDRSFYVDPVPTKFTNAKDITMYYGDVATYSVKVYGDYGTLVKSPQDTYISIKIGSNTYGLFIDNKGMAKIKIGSNAIYSKTTSTGCSDVKIQPLPGKYKITTTYHGAKITTNLIIKQPLTLKGVTVKKSAKKLTLQATLKNKKPIKGKTVTFKFNGKTYKAKTNSKGIAKVTIKKTVLKKLKVGKKITYQATYLKDTVKKTAKVKK